jgi:hypothetical protein
MSTNQSDTLATIDLRLALSIHTTNSTLSIGTIQVGVNERAATPIHFSVILSKTDVIT